MHIHTTFQLSIFDKSLIAFHEDKMFAFDMPNFDKVSHGETIQVPTSQAVALPKTECPYNIYTSEWFGPVEDGRQLLGVYISEQEEHRNRWEEYSFSDMQVFKIELQSEATQGKSSAILPVALGGTFPVAGPRRELEGASRKQPEFETCIKGHRLQRSPTAFYFTGMVKEPKAPILLVKYQFPGSSSTETPSEPSFVKLGDGFRDGRQWVWIQDLAVCHATGRVVFATPHDPFTGTHKIWIVDYLPPPSSRQRQPSTRSSARNKFLSLHTVRSRG